MTGLAQYGWVVRHRARQLSQAESPPPRRHTGRRPNKPGESIHGVTAPLHPHLVVPRQRSRQTTRSLCFGIAQLPAE